MRWCLPHVVRGGERIDEKAEKNDNEEQYQYCDVSWSASRGGRDYARLYVVDNLSSGPLPCGYLQAMKNELNITASTRYRSNSLNHTADVADVDADSSNLLVNMFFKPPFLSVHPPSHVKVEEPPYADYHRKNYEQQYDQVVCDLEWHAVCHLVMLVLAFRRSIFPVLYQMLSLLRHREGPRQQNSRYRHKTPEIE